MEPQNSRTGLIGGIAELAKNMFGLLTTRIELAAVELAQIRTNLLKMAVLFALSVIIAFFAVGYWTALLVFVTWDTMGWKILMIVAAACTVIAASILFYIRSLISQGGLSMPATMEELRHDQDALL